MWRPVAGLVFPEVSKDRRAFKTQGPTVLPTVTPPTTMGTSDLESHIFTLQPKLRGSWWPFGLRRWGLRPLDCWDCGSESRRGHGCSFLLCCVGSDLYDEITRSQGSVGRSVRACARARARVCVVYQPLRKAVTRSQESNRVCVCAELCVCV